MAHLEFIWKAKSRLPVHTNAVAALPTPSNIYKPLKQH